MCWKTEINFLKYRQTVSGCQPSGCVVGSGRKLFTEGQVLAETKPCYFISLQHFQVTQANTADGENLRL